jgi:hypothetical protein
MDEDDAAAGVLVVGVGTPLACVLASCVFDGVGVDVEYEVLTAGLDVERSDASVGVWFSAMFPGNMLTSSARMAIQSQRSVISVLVIV